MMNVQLKIVVVHPQNDSPIFKHLYLENLFIGHWGAVSEMNSS